MFFIKKRTIQAYCYVLLIPIIFNIFIFRDYKLGMYLLIMLISPVLIYCIEKSIHIRSIYIKLDSNIVTGILLMGVIPILEEIIFKHYLFKYVVQVLNFDMYVESIIFVVINSIVFVIAHISEQKQKAIIKLVFAIVSSIIFITLSNIYICIIIHIIFNAIVYTSKIAQYSRGVG